MTIKRFDDLTPEEQRRLYEECSATGKVAIIKCPSVGPSTSQNFFVKVPPDRLRGRIQK